MDDRQATFGTDGSLETERPPEATGTNDFGDEKGSDETDGGYSRYAVASLLQKAVRRSDEKVAAWCAWELSRSGFAWNLWNRLNTVVVEDLRAGSDVALVVARYEELATDRWDADSTMGRRCAIHGALAAARAVSSRESTNAENCFSRVADHRAEARAAEADPSYDFPVDDLDVGGRYDVALDGHTGAGSRAGRGSRFFRVHGARVGPTGESELSRRWQRVAMRLDEFDYDDAEIDHATAAVDADEQWADPDC
jgi:hypothetical protein